MLNFAGSSVVQQCVIIVLLAAKYRQMLSKGDLITKLTGSGGEDDPQEI